jgi:hypothetical protein
MPNKAWICTGNPENIGNGRWVNNLPRVVLVVLVISPRFDFWGEFSGLQSANYGGRINQAVAKGFDGLVKRETFLHDLPFLSVGV